MTILLIENNSINSNDIIINERNDVIINIIINNND